MELFVWPCVVFSLQAPSSETFVLIFYLEPELYVLPVVTNGAYMYFSGSGFGSNMSNIHIYLDSKLINCSMPSQDTEILCEVPQLGMVPLPHKTYTTVELTISRSGVNLTTYPHHYKAPMTKVFTALILKHI